MYTPPVGNEGESMCFTEPATKAGSRQGTQPPAGGAEEGTLVLYHTRAAGSVNRYHIHRTMHPGRDLNP